MGRWGDGEAGRQDVNGCSGGGEWVMSWQHTAVVLCHAQPWQQYLVQVEILVGRPLWSSG
jgi:hypothetical protein